MMGLSDRKMVVVVPFFFLWIMRSAGVVPEI
jgi:hypothetical protein